MKRSMFLKIQAYQNLIDPQKKDYDSLINLMILYQKLFGKMKSIFQAFYYCV